MLLAKAAQRLMGEEVDKCPTQKDDSLGSYRGEQLPYSFLSLWPSHCVQEQNGRLYRGGKSCTTVSRGEARQASEGWWPYCLSGREGERGLQGAWLRNGNNRTWGRGSFPGEKGGASIPRWTLPLPGSPRDHVV